MGKLRNNRVVATADTKEVTKKPAPKNKPSSVKKKSDAG